MIVDQMKASTEDTKVYPSVKVAARLFFFVLVISAVVALGTTLFSLLVVNLRKQHDALDRFLIILVNLVKEDHSTLFLSSKMNKNIKTKKKYFF